MGNSSSAVARSVGWLRFALVVLVCLAFGLALGYSTAPALKWLGKRIAAAEASRPAVVSPDSYASRRTEPVISAKADSDSSFERLPLMPLVGDVDADKRFDVNANTVPRQASADWPLTASSKAVSATSDEGHLFASTLRAGPNVQDSRLGRPVQTDDLRALSSVRTVTHPGKHREAKTHWDYCGNPQCTLCYPVADSKVASDFPDMPQGYCKRHPQSRDCKPIVVPAPKPLPKATDPPVIASAGLGAISRETLAWLLVCVFFVAWVVSGFEVHRLRRRQTVSDFRAKQLARALDLRDVKPPQLAEFKAGCERYQREQYPTDSEHVGKASYALRCGDVLLLPEPSEARPIVARLHSNLPVSRPIRVSEGHIPEAARCDPGDLCSLHKPCAKHGGKPGAAILDEQSNSDYVGVVKEVKPPSAPTQPTNSDERGTDST